MNEILATGLNDNVLRAFLELLKWVGSHYYIFLIVYLMSLTHKASVKRDISYIEVWINGLTPRFFFTGFFMGSQSTERKYLKSSITLQAQSVLDNEHAKKIFTKNDRFTKLSSICEK